ncbi:MAG: dTDP-glucose 4,6-dehydratase [Thermodesulfobacteriota bacterium]
MEVEMKVLITGGAGFIGSNLIKYILKNHPDYTVTNLDKLTYAGNLENLKDIEGADNYRFVQGDIGDRKLIEDIMAEGVDVVFNLAAESHVDRSIIDPEAFVRTNINGTYALLEAARKWWSGAGDQKSKVRRIFIHVSTDEVYGSLKSHDRPFTEGTHLTPNSPYAASKAGSDLLVRSYVKTFSLPAIITRCSNNYGPYQFPEKFIPLMITNALEGNPLPIYGDGLNVRDWISVEDHCTALDVILHKGKEGEVYNIGGDSEFRNIDIVGDILKVLGMSEDMIRFVKDRPGHDRRYAMDFTKLEEELGWRPVVTLKEGLERTVRWYKENAVWWKRVKEGKYRDYYEKEYLKKRGLSA